MGAPDAAAADPHAELRAQVRSVYEDFPDRYWRDLDRERAYPEAFVEAMTASGLLGRSSRVSTAASACRWPRPRSSLRR
jgi:alkylation response protein AidB-like acyl-CoA dehydrogenase